MCRWIAYSGGAIPLDELLFKTEVSLIDQSLAARRTDIPTNGDGFGVGWYGRKTTPALYRDTQPAWNDENLRDIAAQVQASLFLAHVRAATGSAIQRSNCHPFRHGSWLFVHNGHIAEFARLKRELAMAVAPELYAEIAGTTDSELMFFLALTFGLEDSPVQALARMAGLVESVGRAHRVEHPLQMTLGLSDGEALYAVRYSSVGRSRTLYHSKSVHALRELSPDNPRIRQLADDTRLIVSEPLDNLTRHWVEIPEASAIEIRDGGVERQPFAPQ